MRSRPLIAVLGVAAVAVSGCSASAAVDAASASGQSLEWRDCTEEDVTVQLPEDMGPPEPVEVPDGMECADLEVPVDYAEPDGRTILLSVARLPGTGSEQDPETVVHHPGGPAVPGIPEAAMAVERFDRLREGADLVVFNPRGAMGGVRDLFPLEDCFLNGPQYTAPLTEEEFDADVAANEERLEQCREHDPELFDNMDSATRAHDVDALRAALGEEQVNFFGTSYGGPAGAAYARLYPDRVRTMFLDSAVSHVIGYEEEAASDLASLENDFAGFAERCAEDSECVWNGEDVPEAWRAFVARANEDPIPAKEYGDEPYSGYDLTIAGSVLLGYKEDWPVLSDAVGQALGGDASAFLARSQGQPAYIGSVAAATTCADGIRFENYEEYRRASEEQAELSPDFGAAMAGYETLCSAWPAPEANPRGPIDAEGLPPILAAGSTQEFHLTSSLADEIPGSVALEMKGMGHGLYIGDGNECVMAHADRYLVDGTLPEQGTVCRPD
ncbi:alpha/beta fold hydrolase [Nocardiopsis composta]|uniref:Pimeloyl-ACP methyl ester carboxylesterase n=1 Tax=Nocardiopsis composta TaxID=157465 RepID=A0A7W8QND0_9ACTN|nr:alpha/beta fold hydrolase [Nocardiopsis composta]MBB5432636.1 pimeloyl-ACP methyl ester carboxylesterase [Nocardiopsis composta]